EHGEAEPGAGKVGAAKHRAGEVNAVEIQAAESGLLPFAPFTLNPSSVGGQDRLGGCAWLAPVDSRYCPRVLTRIPHATSLPKKRILPRALSSPAGDTLATAA